MSEEAKVFTEAQVMNIAEDAANRAVANLFAKLDIDTDDKESMRRFRDNLNFLDEQREGSIILKQTLKKSAIYLAGSAALGGIYFMWDVFKAGLLMWSRNTIGGP
jgi:hypothetical protein